MRDKYRTADPNTFGTFLNYFIILSRFATKALLYSEGPLGEPDPPKKKDSYTIILISNVFCT